MVLKPVSAAVRDGDMIRAVIRASGSNQDGHTPIITQPSQEAQQDLIQHVYKQANVSLAETRYVEAHGKLDAELVINKKNILLTNCLKQERERRWEIRLKQEQ